MTESTHQVIVSDKPNLAAARVISGGLSRYNREMAGYNDARKLSVLVCENGSDKVIGGLLGRTSLGMFFVDLFFLPKSHRGRGVGTRVIEYAEAEAKKRGCSTAVLYTITFQAPAFYERQGYQVLGHVECQPPGHTRLCMTKKL